MRIYSTRTSSRSQYNAASCFDLYHCHAPALELPMDEVEFYCIVYNIENEGFSAFSADAKGVHGEGVTAKAAVEDLCNAIITRIYEECGGGIYFNRSPWEYQFKILEELWENWIEDGVNFTEKFYYRFFIQKNNSSARLKEESIRELLIT